MGLFDTFKGQKYKSELEDLQTRYTELENLLTPELKDALKLQELVRDLTNQKANLESSISSLNSEFSSKQSKQLKELEALENEIYSKKKKIISFDDEILVQEFGLYSPRFDFATSDEYKKQLLELRDWQKGCIKSETALSGNPNWTVNNSLAKGKKMVQDMQKLLLRAFNSECDETISKIKYNNIETSVKKINASAASISKLGSVMGIAITQRYLDFKIREAYLSFEYQMKKHQEKEDAKEARAQMREAAKLQKEIEEQRKKIKKEQTHYQTAYEKLLKQLEQSPEDSDLLSKKSELETQLHDIDKAIQNIDYREANQKAGYVYIISNIGAFGPDVYKIGMTRRLEPQDRVDELGDASVPFNFDVHAMIFSDDAPALESALHKAFEDRKLNMVNTRREFFNVTLDEIKEVVKKNFDKTVEFVDFPDAEQYRVSQKMKTNANKEI